MNGQMDFMGGGKGVGQVASFLQTNGRMDTATMRPYVAADGKAYISVHAGGAVDDPKNYRAIQVNAATLRPEEWKMLDQALIEVSRERLTGFDYIVSKGLVKTLPNAMATTVLEWQTMSDSQSAIMSMDGVTRGKSDNVLYGQKYLPIPIMHVDYEINQRKLLASRNMGNGIDVEEAKHGARAINVMKEDLLFGSVPFNFAGNSIYSFLNFPDRTTVALAKHWPVATGAEILADVVAMKTAAQTDLHFGPYTLFIPSEYATRLDDDYSVAGASHMTIRERIMKIAGIMDIVVVDRLAADNVLLVQMTSDVVQIVNGLPMQNVQWSVEGNFVVKHKIMEIAVPRLFSDYNGRSGIVHLA